MFQMKRNVLRVGEAELFRRYTNLREKQKVEEDQMAAMLVQAKRPQLKQKQGLVKAHKLQTDPTASMQSLLGDQQQPVKKMFVFGQRKPQQA